MSPWGSWILEGSFEDVHIRVEASCSDGGVVVKCPTSRGMEDLSRESFAGKLSLSLRRRRAAEGGVEGGAEGEEIIVEASSDQAAVEVGGTAQEWPDTWVGSCSVPPAAREILALSDL